MTKRDNQNLESGAEIGVYEIDGFCFADRFSITYRALNHHLNQSVALTEYFPQDLAHRQRNSSVIEAKSDGHQTQYQRGLAKFIDLADALVQVQHENVLGAHNVLWFNNTAYLVTDYREDRCISIDDGVTENEFVENLMALLGALEHLHQRGIIHGGICPDAIFLNKHKGVILGRFAVARLATETANGPCENELPAAYAAIEQYDVESRVGPAADIFGLGGVFYACLKHTVPLTSRLRLQAMRRNEPDPLPQLTGFEDRGNEPGWVKLVESMLAIEQNNRPNSAGAALVELHASLVDAQSQSDEVAQGLSDWSVGRWAASAAVFALLGLFGLWLFQDRGNRFVLDNAVNQSQSKSHSIVQDSTGVKPAQSSDQSQASSFSALETADGQELQADTTAGNVAVEAIAESKPSSDELANLNAADPPTIEVQGPIQRAESIKYASEAVGDVKWHLDEAQKDFKALRLTTPRGNNAYEHYVAVLTLESENQAALEGQERIVDMYIWLIGNAIQQAGRKRAEVYIARAEKIAPNNHSLKSLRKDLVSMNVNSVEKANP